MIPEYWRHSATALAFMYEELIVIQAHTEYTEALKLGLHVS